MFEHLFLFIFIIIFKLVVSFDLSFLVILLIAVLKSRRQSFLLQNDFQTSAITAILLVFQWLIHLNLVWCYGAWC